MRIKSLRKKMLQKGVKITHCRRAMKLDYCVNCSFYRCQNSIDYWVMLQELKEKEKVTK